MKNTLRTIYTVSACIAIIALCLLFTHDWPNEVRGWKEQDMVSHWIQDHSEIPDSNNKQ